MATYSYKSSEACFTPEFKEAIEAHKAMYALLFSNNRYMLRLEGKTLLGQLREFKRQGVVMSKQCYYKILRGTFASGNVAIPHIISKYWGIPVWRVVSTDFKTEANLREIRLKYGLPVESLAVFGG